MILIVAVGAAAAVLVTLTLAVPLKPLGRLLGGITVALCSIWWLTDQWLVAEGVAGGFFGMFLQYLYELIKNLSDPATHRSVRRAPSARPGWPPR